MKRKPAPVAPTPAFVWPRTDPKLLADFDTSTKVCSMNCGPHRDDPRTAAERKFQCDECYERVSQVNQQDAAWNTQKERHGAEAASDQESCPRPTMSLEYAIHHASTLGSRDKGDCGKEHLQLADWLTELKSLRSEKITSERQLSLAQLQCENMANLLQSLLNDTGLTTLMRPDHLARINNVLGKST